MGMQLSSGSSKGAQPNINVTPLVDVVLVLLIIFMVVLPSVQDGVQINMFESKAAKKKQLDDDAIIVTLTQDDKIYVGENELTLENSLAQIQASRQVKEDVQIVLRADAKMEYGKVRDWFKAAQDLGVGKIDLAVMVKKGKGDKDS